MTKSNHWIAALAVGSLAVGCAPATDWREFMPEGSGLHVAFPCRPDRMERTVVVAGRPVQMSMLSCRSGDVTYGVGFLEAVEPQRVTAALSELRANVVSNVHGSVLKEAPAQISGMTANARAAYLVLAGHLPDGAPVQEHAAFFAHGLHVYQAAVIGVRLGPDVTDPFFGALKFP